MAADTQLPGKNQSLWIGTTPSTNYPELNGKYEVDVAVIGGGIAGITAAYFLAREGKKVAVVEAFRIVTSTSGHTTAKVTSLHGLIYDFLIGNFGRDKAQIYADSNQWAIDEMERIVRKENIDCGFARVESSTYTNQQDSIDKIKQEVEAAHALGLPVTYKENGSSLPFPVKSAVVFFNQALFHPRKYLLKLADIITKQGGLIFENSRVETIEPGEPCTIKTENGEIKATDVIVATNYPIYDKKNLYTRMDQVRSYAYAIQPKGSYPQDMYLGIGSKEPSVRPYSESGITWLIIGGEDHPVGTDEDATKHFSQLQSIIDKLFEVKSYDYRWAAQDSSPIDNVPYIGHGDPDNEHIYVTTGFNEWGMTKSLVSAKVLADLIAGRKNEWAEFYDPSRVNIQASLGRAGEMGKQVMKGYGEYVTKVFDHEVNDLQNGEGKVIEKDGDYLAVRKDDKGKLHAVSAKCTHMGCIVGWNKGDQTWDCPCHGSRFTKEGNVIHGPAIKKLASKKIES